MDTALAIIGGTLCVLFAVAGVGATVVGLPGTLLILLTGVVSSAVTGWERPPWWGLLILLALTLIAETSDNLLSMLGARQGGASGRTGLMAMVGGLAGALTGAALSPIFGSIALLGGVVGFVLGTLIVPLGLALVGGYLAAYWYERHLGRDREAAIQAGKGALVGRLLGGMLKSLLAALMAAVLLYMVFRPAVGG